MSSRVRVEFRLSMPSRGSWDGRWSGEDRNYVIVQTVPDQTARMLMDPQGEGGRWYHRWDDGWGALITARILGAGERPPKSDGFCGYDWMVRNIVAYGSPYEPRRAAAPSSEPEQASTEGEAGRG